MNSGTASVRKSSCASRPDDSGAALYPDGTCDSGSIAPCVSNAHRRREAPPRGQRSSNPHFRRVQRSSVGDASQPAGPQIPFQRAPQSTT